jgi:hypothetical protein
LAAVTNNHRCPTWQHLWVKDYYNHRIRLVNPFLYPAVLVGCALFKEKLKISPVNRCCDMPTLSSTLPELLELDIERIE